MAEPDRLSCNECDKTFSRIDHLKRHMRSHNSSRPHKCSQCGKSYARRDVLKRHRQSCEDGLLRPVSTRAEKTHNDSSHLFSKFRTAKSKDLPLPELPTFEHCEDVSATIDAQLAILSSDDWETAEELVPYQSPSWTTMASNDLGPELFFTGLCGTNATEVFVTQDPVSSFPFLVRFTAGLGLRAAYQDPIANIEELFDLELPHNGYTESDAGSLDVPALSLASSSPQESEGGGSESSLSGCSTAHVGCVSYSTAMTLLPRYLDANSLIGKCLEIVADIKQARCTMKPSEAGGDVHNDAIAAQFFSPARLLSFLDYYWSEWHPNLPVVHRPLFAAASTPTPLLAAMAVIGARYSPCIRDQDQSKVLYDLVEQLVFNQLSSLASHVSRNRQSQRRAIQTLQAACIIVILQSKDGEMAHRLRCRRQRMSQIIEFMHLLPVSTAKHPDYRGVSVDDFDWIAYIEKEELVRICNWCFTIDAAFVAFYNLAPRLSLRELKMGLQSTEPCFDAISAETCLFELQKWQYQTDFKSETSLYECLRLFCREEIDFATQTRFAHQNRFTIFCIASAFLVMLFNMDPELGPLSQYEPLMIAINNWRMIWNRKNILASDAPPQGSMGAGATKEGYWKHCAEYWLLAYVSVQQIFNAKTAGSAPSNDALIARSRLLEYDESSQSKLHNYIQAYSCGMITV